MNALRSGRTIHKSILSQGMATTTDALRSTNWDFRDAPAITGIHAIHPYPAKFIPQIPRRLIELFHPGDSSPVLDPFCGSGTTLVEAIGLGLDAWGIDLNPLACLIARVKTRPVLAQVDRIATRISENAQKKFSGETLAVPSIPRVDHWFKPEVQRCLTTLTEEINQEPELIVREALQVALSSIIVRVSNQESDTRYAAITKNISAQDVFTQFEKAAVSIFRAIASFSDDLFRRLGRATVLNKDILDVTPGDLPGEVGLVVCSPPYPNAYEYWLYHKYRMYWLGMDPIEVRRREIGARPHYFRVNHQDEHDYERQMATCFCLLSRVMRKNAKACFVIGDSIIHGRVIDNVSLLRRAAEPYGFAVEGTVPRTIPGNRKTFNPAHGRIEEEHLVILGLVGKR